MSKAVIYFVKLPIVGFNKTRLQGFLPKEDIHHLSKYLLSKTFKELQLLDAEVLVFVTPSDRKDEISEHLNVEKDKIFAQKECDHLGERMRVAMKEVFNMGYEKVALVGCDLVDITKELLEDVFRQLESYDVVFAPTADGGYGIAASRKFRPEMFAIDEYSHDQVFFQSKSVVEKAGLACGETKLIHDLDTREDVAKYLANDPSASFLNQGEYNANFLIDNGKKILRIALGSQMHLDNQIEYEFLALRGLASSGVVPKVYLCQAKTEILGKGFLIEEYLPGRPLNYEKDLKIAAELLAKVHNVDCEQIPSLIVANHPFQVMYEEFLEMFNHYQNWPHKDLVVEAKISSLMASLANYDRDQELENPCVINTELNSHNFIINPEGKSYIIDWEKPLIGEKEQDLAHFLAPTTTLWRTDVALDRNQIDQFIETYNIKSNNPIKLEKLKQYLHFTCLRGITWCSMAYVQYLESSKVKNNDQTFETISKFISVPFLEQIENYIKMLGEIV
ncbi:TIGR04282 family arsenosugar biosynthesis glycosyltransferase [Facklamia sp. DSM 111018]|uniref:TIGR04282 family arsenosugar biosynthesis glycosyltransferase n=1 Tax=Facklamia lactis TaxID=2749967 RepID=A0ABS0LPZ8_9LACT|nr:TIGR04282 family arsenosugar biosynthesis glycosyltransferase [Facklamia lactis]MBG9986079.1 TIGR04282 family arsenosugar biosynthesis glycosyltransferase [Facklamia lactis]